MKNTEEMTREEVIALLGEESVKEVESLNCEYDGESWGYDRYESSLKIEEGRVLVAVYYQPSDVVRNTEDLGSLTWIPDHFYLRDF